jgi:hypothetical protein
LIPLDESNISDSAQPKEQEQPFALQLDKIEIEDATVLILRQGNKNVPVFR